MAGPNNSATQAGPSAAQPAATPSAPPTPEQLIGLLTSDADPSKISQTLKNIVRDPVLYSLLPSGQDPLELLDPEVNTLGFLYILAARLTATNAPPPQQSAVWSFCRSFDPAQARLAPDRITALAKGIVRASGDNLKYAIGPLRDLTVRYPPTPSHLTTLHQIFLNACVVARHYSAALPVLANPIINIDNTLSDLTYNDNLLYHYAGGVALGALKRWREAEEFFEIVVTAPSQVPAAVQYEALKKLALVQLILYGKANPPPKYTNSVLARLLRNSPYYTFAKSYPQTISKLTVAISKDEEMFRSEKNMGLVQQAIGRAPRWLIKRLTLTYLTLGLRDIAAQTGIGDEDEVRALLLDMVDAGEITASVSVDGTVTFADTVPQFSKTDIDTALAQAHIQSKLLLKLERDMNVSKEYMTKALKHKDEAWGAPDEEMYNVGSSAHWGDDF